MDLHTSLMAFEFLADQGRHPAALLLLRDGGHAAAGLPAGFCAGMPAATPGRCCYLPSGAESDALLQQAGWRPLPDGDQWQRGDWYMAAPARAGHAQAASRVLALQMVQLVAAEADNHEIEALLRRDPALSYHLLRLVNSLGVGAGKKIASFGQALLVLGRSQLRRWLHLMLFSSRDGDARAPMLMARAAARARFMELLAREAAMDKAGQEQAFMAGMFSLLGILFGMPLADVLQPLKISEPLGAALLREDGELGLLLRAAHAAEAADFQLLGSLLSALRVDGAACNRALLEAHDWALTVALEQTGAAHG